MIYGVGWIGSKGLIQTIRHNERLLYMEYLYEDYLLSDDKTRLSAEAVYQLLSGAYWVKNRTLEQIKITIDNSLCYGLFHHGRQIGFVRVVTDQVTFYYICDFIISPEYRKKGLGSFMLKNVLSRFEGQNMKGLLITRDAQEFYKKLGFINPPEPILMIKS